MKKILILDACIRREDSRTKLLMERAVSILKEKHPGWEMERLSLQDLELSFLDQKSLRDRDQLLEEKAFNHPRFRYARQFQEADGIIVAAPFWDLSFPAVLKIYIENVSVDGLTFFCDAEGLHGKCRAEWMLHLVTRGGIWKEDMCQDSRYLEAMCGFFGIKKYHCISADGIDIVGLDREKIMKDAMDEVTDFCSRM